LLFTNESQPVLAATRLHIQRITGERETRFNRELRQYVVLNTATAELSYTKGSVQVRGLVKCFVTPQDLRRRIASTSTNRQDGGPHRVCCPRMLTQYIRNYTHIWRPFLHPQPEDALWGQGTNLRLSSNQKYATRRNSAILRGHTR